MNTEDFITYDQAVKLKELGFDWKCYTFYHWDNWCGLSDSGICENHNMFEKCFSAPTLSQAQKWLREVKDIIVLATCNLDYEKGHEWYWFVDKDVDIEDPEHFYETYEQALSTAIDKALDLLTQPNNGNQD